MYEEITLDPHCMSEYHYYGLLKERFGFDRGRYIIAPVREWARAAFNAVKESTDLQDVKKQSIKNYLNKIYKEKDQSIIYLPQHRSHIDYIHWSDWVQKQQTYAPFHLIISETYAGALNYDKIINGDEKWNIPPTKLINTSAESIYAEISPLLKIGNEITIIDPYFVLSGNKVLHAIFNSLTENTGIVKIVLVTAIDAANVETIFQNEFKCKYKNIPTFEYILIPDNFVHDRYLIANKGALKSGHGFSERVEKGVQADKLSISLCGIEECFSTKEWIDRFVLEKKAVVKKLYP